MRALLLSLLMVISTWATSQESAKPKKGELSGQWRTFFLGTYNKGDLKDFYALASGGKIGYVYTFNDHFKIGGFAYSSFNFNIQDLTQPDPFTGKISRYEAGLFDATDLDDRLVLFPGELYLSYTVKHHNFTIGRMKIVSPFINPEDGRMIPTLEQGFWYKYKPEKPISLQAGILNAIAPRSTGGFYKIGESLGTYPVGRNIDQSSSGYYNNTTSGYIAITNINWHASERIKIEAWNYYTDNIFNTLYVKPSWQISQSSTQLAFEWAHQSRVGEGGNALDSLRYFSAKSSDVLGAQLSFGLGKTKATVGYDHILPHGRFLFPREWGREFLFSFQKRERSEGSADNQAVVMSLERSFNLHKSTIRSILSIGHHWKPDVTNAADNKYAMPDYTHINLDFFYGSEKIKNLKPELLLTYKSGTGEYPDNPNFELNKVDMFQVNFVVNYNF